MVLTAYPARQTPHLRRKAAGAPEPDKRRIRMGSTQKTGICARFAHLARLGKPPQKALRRRRHRELLGFVWAIAREIDGPPASRDAA